MNTTETFHHKFIAKYNALRDLINYVRFVIDQFQSPARADVCEQIIRQLNQHEVAIEKSFMNYEDCSTGYVVDHYKVSTVSREEVNRVFSRYQKHVCANNVLDDVENIFRRIKDTIDQIKNIRGFKTFVKNSRPNTKLQTRAQPTPATPVPAPDENSAKAEFNDDDDETAVKLFLMDLHNKDLSDLSAFDTPAKSVDKIELVTISCNIAARMDFEETCNRICTYFLEQRIVFVYEKANPDLCKICKIPMIMYTDDAELRCEECGLIQLLSGTVYDDSQSDTQTVQGTKNKRHDPKRHCDKRLKQIQAKEDWKIVEDVIMKLNTRALKEYRHRNGLLSMRTMTCKQIRRWLKLEKLTKHNHHAPTIRKIITGMHGEPVIPPQLTMEEEQEVLIDFSEAMICYEQVTQTDEYRRKYEKDRTRQRQRSKPNRFYYWFVIFKILSQKFADDPRLPGMLECIHLQSDKTLAKDDDIWAMMCEYPEMKDYHAEHTDRNFVRLVL